MANSRFQYVRNFEQDNKLLPDTWIVMRLDGRGFHKFSKKYEFEKPNDLNALNLMNYTAEAIMKRIPDIILAYGDSDEYSFVLDKQCILFERRESKLVSTFASTFTACYQALWNEYFPEKPLQLDYLPTFDCRAVMYPNDKTLKDYLSWRQADCHINNLYNTTFWMLVIQGARTPQEAEQELCGTSSADKNEILFKLFGINYNFEPEIFKKGTILIRDVKEKPQNDELSKRQVDRQVTKKLKAEINHLHVDLIGEQFWKDRPWLLK